MEKELQEIQKEFLKLSGSVGETRNEFAFKTVVMCPTIGKQKTQQHFWETYDKLDNILTKSLIDNRSTHDFVQLNIKTKNNSDNNSLIKLGQVRYFNKLFKALLSNDLSEKQKIEYLLGNQKADLGIDFKLLNFEFDVEPEISQSYDCDDYVVANFTSADYNYENPVVKAIANSPILSLLNNVNLGLDKFLHYTPDEIKGFNQNYKSVIDFIEFALKNDIDMDNINLSYNINVDKKDYLFFNVVNDLIDKTPVQNGYAFQSQLIATPNSVDIRYVLNGQDCVYPIQIVQSFNHDNQNIIPEINAVFLPLNSVTIEQVEDDKLEQNDLENHNLSKLGISFFNKPDNLDNQFSFSALDFNFGEFDWDLLWEKLDKSEILDNVLNTGLISKKEFENNVNAYIEKHEEDWLIENANEYSGETGVSFQRAYNMMKSNGF